MVNNVIDLFKCDYKLCVIIAETRINEFTCHCHSWTFQFTSAPQINHKFHSSNKMFLPSGF